MVRSLLIRGMLAGLVAGMLAFVVARLIGETPVELAIGFEEQHAHEHEEGAELVSRATQSGLGLAVATAVFGVAIGGLFALAFAVAHGRIGSLAPRATAAVLGVVGFVSVYLIPFLKYPANPPAVGNPNTIGERTGMYFLMIAISVLFAIAAMVLRKRAAVRLGEWNATVLAGAAFLVLIAVVMWLLPAADVSTGEFPAAVLWEFRIASIGIQAALWVVLAAGFGPLAERVLGKPRVVRS
ncbi:MAG: hypothetical protein GEU98_13135 [Pseudonocardiaceae bacterium]|nr:hypothetical protein [Pseudonocardiaceae bacterium]